MSEVANREAILAGPEVQGRVSDELLAAAEAAVAAGTIPSYRDLTVAAGGEDLGPSGSYWAAARAIWAAEAVQAPALRATPASVAVAREKGKLRFEEIAIRLGVSVGAAKKLYAVDAERRGNDPLDSSIGRGTLVRAAGRRADHGTAGKRRPDARKSA